MIRFVAMSLLGVALFGCGEQALPDDSADSESEGSSDELGGTDTTESGATEAGSTTEPEPMLAGTHLLAIETALDPDPFQFVVEVGNVAETQDGMTADFVFQPLYAQMCTGEPLAFAGVAFDAEGHFELDMGLVTLPGEPDPMGVETQATLVLHGHLVAPDTMCGDVTGLVVSPLEYDLTGSTFAAIPLPDGCDTAMFPAPASDCVMP